MKGRGKRGEDLTCDCIATAGARGVCIGRDLRGWRDREFEIAKSARDGCDLIGGRDLGHDGEEKGGVRSCLQTISTGQ